MVNTLRSDPQTSEEEHFKLVLVQTEMERVKFLIRAYVRTRLHKVSAMYLTFGVSYGPAEVDRSITMLRFIFQ